MKSIIFLMVFTPLMMATPVNLEEIANAISSGDAAALAKHFAADVDVIVLDDINLYTKAEAKKAMADFFTTNKPLKYTQVHQGESQGATGQYCVGILETAKQKYRVNLYLEKTGDKFLIKEIKFENQ